MVYKLICFDVDGTLIDNVEFSWVLMHDFFGTNNERREDARDKFFNKEISYEEWAKHDIEMWKENGANKESLQLAMKQIKLMEGATDTIYELKKKGIKLAIISGSFNIFLEYLLPEYNDLFDDVYINKLIFDDEGEIIDLNITSYDMGKKANALLEIAKREGLKLDECVFVGDHHNDVDVVREAGLGIAFNCKSDELRKVSNVVIEKKDLREVLKHVLK